jgi:hypothetical protein
VQWEGMVYGVYSWQTEPLLLANLRVSQKHVTCLLAHVMLRLSSSCGVYVQSIYYLFVYYNLLDDTSSSPEHIACGGRILLNWKGCG